MMHRSPSSSLRSPSATALCLAVIVGLAADGIAQGLHVGPTEPADPTATHPTGRPGPRPGWRPGISPAIRIESLSIKATIVDGVATTKLTQVFHNSGSRPAEGTWILPLPKGATADHFTMTMNGKQVSGEVLDANRARQVYTAIVRRQRDPGLLEYMGDGCLRARVYPIPAKGDMTVEVQFRQVLPETAGVHHWSFPLRNAHVSGVPAKRLNLDVSIRSKTAIKNVYSPSADVDVSRTGDHTARVSMELYGRKLAARDLDVFYGLSDKEFGLNLLSHRKRGDPGYFVLMLSPRMQWDATKVMPKCVNFVVDTSGSMNGEKIHQARAALAFFVNSLHKFDFFNVIPFSTEARPFFNRPLTATAEHVQKALARAKELTARGGTNIEQALATALSQPMPEVANLVGITVFLTDGMPTVDTTDTDTLLRIVSQKNTAKHRIFVFGVGHDVNTKLLDRIARDSHGDRDYVRENENIEVKTGALFTKLSYPVMSNVKIDCAGIDGFDVFPKTTPDLFKGSRLMLTGRYKGTGNHAIRLRGIVEGREKTFVYEATFPAAQADNDFIPTLWAQRKVAELLDAIRLNGSNPELVREVRRLGSEHGIVTPYTSNLVAEQGEKLSRARGFVPPRHGRRSGRGGGFDRGPVGAAGAAGPTTPGAASPPARVPPAEVRRIAKELRRAGVVGGKDAEKKVEADLTNGRRRKPADAKQAKSAANQKQAAVDYSLALRALSRSKNIESGTGRTNLRTHHIQGHTFLLIGGTWVDNKFTAGMEKRVKKINAFSDAYFDLLNTHDELAKILAFSTRIVIVLGDLPLEITPAD